MPAKAMEIDGEPSDVEMQEPLRAPLVNGRPHGLRVTEESSSFFDETSGTTVQTTATLVEAVDPNQGSNSNGFTEPSPVNGVSKGEVPLQGGECVLGAYRPSISQEVFEKIRERITASKEREKQSLAKQILRKEEEKKKLARDRDAAADMESKIAKLRENIRQEKDKQMKLFTQMKQAKNAEESFKKQQKDAKDRGRDMSGNFTVPPQHHSYANASMLISQTNPAMRPRLLNYPSMNVPMTTMVHQNNTHLDPHGPHVQKRQRSVSPGVERVSQAHAQSMHSAASRQPSSVQDTTRNRAPSTGAPPSAKIPRPNMLPPAESPHSSRTSRSPPKPSPGGIPMSSASHTPMPSPVGMAGAFGGGGPYATLGSQVLCLVPNMLGAATGVAPQLMLQKPENIAALSPQQQSLMAQQIHAMNANNPEYMRALQQALENQQQSVRAAGEAALYRQYAAGLAGLPPNVMQPQMLIRTGVPGMVGGQSNNAAHNNPASSAQLPDGSQRVGSIMTGVPVFGPGMGGSPYGGGTVVVSSTGPGGTLHSRVTS